MADAAAWFSRPGPRLVEGLEWLGHVLHPDRVPEPPGGVRARLADDGEDRARDHGGAHDHARDDRRQLRPRRRLASLLDHPGGDEAADQSADVAAERDPRFENRIVIARLSARIGIRPDCIRSIWRLRAITIAPPSRP